MASDPAPFAVRRQPRFVGFTERPHAGMRLYCFPFAGGAANVYRPWQQLIPLDVELLACQLPGRHDRMHEAPFTDATRLAARLADDLALEGDDRPFAFFGHSMGALVAFELARELQRRRAPLPAVLGVSGRAAPDSGAHHTTLHLLPSSDLIRSLSVLGGVPEEVLAIPELIELMVPVLRADLELVETYRYVRDGGLLHCPITVFGGSVDPMVDAAGLGAWQDCSTRPVVIRVFSGGHFYPWSRPVGEQLIQVMLTRFRSERNTVRPTAASTGGEVASA